MDNFLWVEKWRPQKIADTILLPKMKKTFQAIVDSGDMPNMLFTGTAGLGKTTVAKALCNEMDLDYIIINGSEEGNIDTLRYKIKQFASTVSLSGGVKVVILDEADYLNPSSFQPALRGFMEEFSKNCRFILTCNYKNRIIEPLHSRTSVYEFNTTRKEMFGLASAFMTRVIYILETEKIPFDEKIVADLIQKHMPDWRRVLNELQRTAISGSISESTITTTSTKFKDLYESLKAKDFKKMRQWVVNNIDTESSAIFRGLYDEMVTYLKPTSIPQMIIHLGKYQYQAAFVADQEINIVACMTELMVDLEFL